MLTITISEIQIIPVKPKNGLVAFASCVINNQLYLGNLAIYTSPSSPEGYRLVYPTRTLKSGAHLSIAHPINKETGVAIQEQIVEQYLKLMENLDEVENYYEIKRKSD